MKAISQGKSPYPGGITMLATLVKIEPPKHSRQGEDGALITSRQSSQREDYSFDTSLLKRKVWNKKALAGEEVDC